MEPRTISSMALPRRRGGSSSAMPTRISKMTPVRYRLRSSRKNQARFLSTENKCYPFLSMSEKCRFRSCMPKCTHKKRHTARRRYVFISSYGSMAQRTEPPPYISSIVSKHHRGSNERPPVMPTYERNNDFGCAPVFNCVLN